MHVSYFNDLFVLLQPLLRAYLAKQVPPADIDDVLQETFSALWNANHPNPVTEEDHRKLRALAYKIANRRASDFWRAKFRSDRKVLAARQLHCEALGPSAFDALMDQTPPAWRLGLSVDTLRVLDLLSDGSSVAEIALELGITPNAVSQRLKRIRERIHQLLAEQAATEDSA